jgi:glycerol uptake facilitator-like aquaporin
MGVDDSLFGSVSRTQVLQMLLAELVGTGMLIFLGCMGTVVGMTHAPHPHLLTAFAFGLTVMIVIQVGACKTEEAISNLQIINQSQS